MADRLAIEGQILLLMGLFGGDHRRERAEIRSELKGFSDDELKSFRDEIRLEERGVK